MQVDELRVEAARRGWKIVGTYTDEGVSGSRERRPQLDRLLAEVRAGKLDVVAVWKLDRLGRSMQHLVQLLDTFKRSGVDFVSLRDAGIDTTSATGTLAYRSDRAYLADSGRDSFWPPSMGSCRGNPLEDPSCRHYRDFHLRHRAFASSVQCSRTRRAASST